MKKNLSILGLVALAMLPASAPAETQFPNKPIRIIVPTTPGGAPDVAARLLGGRLSDTLGQPVVVENKTGANGNIAGEHVAHSAADGYTLLLVPDSVITVNPHIYRKLQFDSLKDLVPVTSVFQAQFALTIRPSLPAKTLPEFVAYARKADPPLRYASAGPGSMHQIGIEMLKQRAGIDLTNVPYRGGATATLATVAGETHVVLAGVGAVGLIQSGKLRPLATTGAKRSALFPDLRPVAEFYPGYDLTVWAGLFAPAGTPEPVVSRLRAEVQKALADPGIANKLTRVGADPLILTPQDFSARIQRDYEKYRKLVNEIGLKVQ